MTISANAFFSAATIFRIKSTYARLRPLETRGIDVSHLIDEVEKSGIRKHGFSSSKNEEMHSLYICYRNIVQRCDNPNHPRYKDYGGRGIENRFASFFEFARHVGLRPGPDYSIDRIENDGHYEIGNLRWSSLEEQANNRRDTKKRVLH